MIIKGIIFDMDGTLLDTEPIAVEATDYVTALYGIKLSHETKLRFMGMAGEVVRQYFYDNFGSDFDYDGYRQKKIEYQEAVVERDGVTLKKGAREILDFARENDIACAIATSSGRERAEGLLARSGLEEYFSAFVCGYDVEKGKPHPDIFLFAAEKLGLTPKECIGIEDSQNGITAVHDAGMYSILVPDMVPANEISLKAADLCCRDLTEALEFIKRIYEKA